MYFIERSGFEFQPLINSQPEHFFRIHRAFIINKKMIKEVKYLNNNTFEFKLLNCLSLQSSRSYKNQIKKHLDKK